MDNLDVPNGAENRGVSVLKKMTFLAVWLAITCGTPMWVRVASAQIKPATSGEPSFYEPEMRPHGEGTYRPNSPHRHTFPQGFHARRLRRHY